MFNWFTAMYATNAPRAIGILVLDAIVFGLLLWVSIIDIKKMSVTFYKMLLASGSTIACPLAISLFYWCDALTGLKWYLMAAVPLWFLLLYWNIKRNRDKFMGRADVDLLTALLSEGVCYSLWLLNSMDASAAMMHITAFWHRFAGYLAAGGLAFLVIVMVILGIKCIKSGGAMSMFYAIKSTRISIIPMFMPVAVMIPLDIMLS